MTDSAADVAAWVCRNGQMTALVGAGGKTTLMYALAQQLAAAGRSIIVTTTTHIWAPAFLPLAGSLPQLTRLQERHRLVVLGQKTQDGKLVPPPDFDAVLLKKRADHVLVEADGSRSLPCKVPAAHEPVIPPEADAVLGVAGLQALDKPLAEACFRPEAAAAMLEKTAVSCISTGDLARILNSREGTRKQTGERAYAACLNQCDTPALEQRAAQIRSLLAADGLHDVFCTTSAWAGERRETFGLTN